MFRAAVGDAFAFESLAKAFLALFADFGFDLRRVLAGFELMQERGSGLQQSGGVGVEIAEEGVG